MCSDICPWILTARFTEQIMSTDKYPNIFSRWWRLLCLLSFKHFSQHAQFWNWRISLGYSTSFGWSVFRHMTRLDQSRVSDNVCWIISGYSCWKIANSILCSRLFKPRGRRAPRENLCGWRSPGKQKSRTNDGVLWSRDGILVFTLPSTPEAL